MIEKNTIMSPMQIWHDYNPVSQDTEISIINLTTEDDIQTTEIMFTVSAVEDGKIRGYMKYYKKVGTPDDAPVILLIPGTTMDIQDEVLDRVLDAGLVYATFDYAGMNEKHT